MIITEELEDKLFAMQRTISTHEDLEEFLEFLEGKYIAGLIDETNIREFLSNAADISGSLAPEEMQNGQPTWRLVGEIILAAVLRD